jgi:EAL domain-containing protein (putative c-di-GMP-specific phosphodiesterase class I)
LRQLTTTLKAQVGDEMRVDRVGSDQFVILLREMHIEQARQFARNVLDEISERRFDWSDRSYDVTASAGIVPITETTANYQEIWSDAYFACDLAKEQGGDRVQVSVETSHETRKRREGMDWATRLRRAMKEDRLILYRQGITSLRKNTVHSEILLRYQDDDGAIISAAKFIPAAERYNLITEIDFYVVRKALQFMASEPEANSYSINLSGMSLGNRELLDLIISELDQNNVDPERVCFEITETAAIRNHTDAVKFMNVLHGLGCHFFLDDFGTGLSSFGYLKTLPLDLIKVDAHFVQSIETEEASRSIIQAITTIAHGFGIKTVAEGVENEHQLAILGGLGIDYVQGYLIEKPARLMAA